jgi:hypothetical protein
VFSFPGMNTALQWWDLRLIMLKLIGTMVGEFVCNLLAEVITQVGMRRTLSHLRMRLFRGIISQPYARLESVDRGELQNRIMVDTTFVVLQRDGRKREREREREIARGWREEG